MRLIKRYSNRKLYDTNESRYVTLEQLNRLIVTGESIRVVDKESDKDLTVQTLTQVLFESQKDQPSLTVQELEVTIRRAAEHVRNGDVPRSARAY